MPATPDVLAKVGAMEDVARRHGVPLAAPALQFPLRDPAVSSVLIGTAEGTDTTLQRNIKLSSRSCRIASFPNLTVDTLVAAPLGEDAVRV